MLAATTKILERFGATSVAAMKRNAAKYSASGRMAKSFRYEIGKKGITIYGVDYLEWAEEGRGRTGGSARTGNPTLYQQIFEWLKTKGIPLWRDKKGRYIGRATMAFIISRKIHREGTKLHRDKGFRNIYTRVFTPTAINSVISKASKEYALVATSDLIKSFNSILDKRG